MQAVHGSPTALSLHDFAFQPATPPLTLDIHRRECVALLGIGSDPHDIPRLTDALTGRSPLLGGSLMVEGVDVTANAPHLRGIAAIGPQAPLFPHLSVLDNILFPLRATRTLPDAEILRRGNETLALTGLDALRDTPAGRLSGLQFFRAALARALIRTPSVLVLQQPFDTLDQTASEQAMAMLDRLRHAIGLSALLLTRSRTEALMAADRTGILENGALIQLATAPTLMDRPASSSVAVAMSNANVLTGKVLDIDDDTAILRLPTGETVEAATTPMLEENDLASICIPPDRLSVLFPRQMAADTPEAGDVICTLVSAHHLGHTIAMRLRTRDGTEILAQRPPVHTTRDLAAGRQAVLAWQARNAIAFPMDQKTG